QHVYRYFSCTRHRHKPHPIPTRRSSDLQPVPQAGGPQKKTDSNEASPSSLTAGRRGRMGGRGEQSVKGAGDSSPALGPVVKMPGDRKSTRLNSSHQIISYAVFCLKKKTT